MAKASKIQSATVVDLDKEDSIGEVGTMGKVVPAQSNRRTGVSRKDPSEHPACPHCGGKMHWNQAAATINFECLWRQYNLSTGAITDPNERLPVFTDDDLNGLMDWAVIKRRSRKNPLRYGKMEAPGGGFSSYSAMKAASTKSLTVGELAEEVATPKKKGRPKKAKNVAEVSPVIPPLKSKKLKNKTAQPVVEIAPTKKGKAKKVKAVEEPEFEFEDLDMIEDEPVSKPKKAKRKNAPVVTEQPSVAKKGSGKTKKVKRKAA